MVNCSPSRTVCKNLKAEYSQRHIATLVLYMAKQIIRPIELPTQHARDLAVKAGIHNLESETKNVNEWERQENKLAMFQQMSLNSELQHCLSIYEEDKITKKQQDALANIHKHSKDWIMGHVTGELLKRLSSSTTDAKEANEIAKTIRENVGAEAGGKQKTRGRLVRFTELPESSNG